MFSVPDKSFHQRIVGNSRRQAGSAGLGFGHVAIGSFDRLAQRLSPFLR
jgi:hypothetical protein